MNRTSRIIPLIICYSKTHNLFGENSKSYNLEIIILREKFEKLVRNLVKKIKKFYITLLKK